MAFRRDQEETQKQIPDVVKELGITYPLAIADDIPGINEHYNISSLPTMILIDRQGNVAEVVDGYHPITAVEPKIVALLKEAP